MAILDTVVSRRQVLIGLASGATLAALDPTATPSPASTSSEIPLPQDTPRSLLDAGYAGIVGVL